MMRSPTRWVTFTAVGVFVAVAAIVTPLWCRRATSSSKSGRDRSVFSGALPKLDGSHLKATIVEVTYGPGESSAPHSHPCPVIGYVLQGALRTKVKGEAEHVYKSGESFYEAPNGIHEISANASASEPVRFLAYFVCDRDTPLSVPPPKSAPGEQSHER